MTIPLRVLIVEDSPTDAKLVTRELRRMDQPIDVERVETAGAMRDALERTPWDLVLSDSSMPKFSAHGALDLLKELRLNLPFIIVSGTIGEEAAVDAIRAGAHDYVLKDKLGRLLPAVERALRGGKERAAHRESESRRVAMLESAIDAIVGMDHTGRITELNPAAERTFGYSRAEALGQPLAKLLPDVSLIIGKRIEVIARHRDGTEFPVELAITQVGSTTPPSFMGFMRDISERKVAEEARLALEAQLRQAQKMEAVGRLAGGIAHDFNNVLSVILSYTELILADLATGDPIRADLEEIQKAGTRAADLTRQLLVFSRQQVVEPKVVDLNGVLEGMDKMLRRIVGEDVELTSIAGATLGRVCVEPSSIDQVIMNLVVNARDAMPQGGKLTMETSNAELDEEYAKGHLGAKAGSYVMLSVTDAGTGMDKATLARIFDPFFTTKEKGTGLGLSTVFGIVQQSGGNIWVYSEPGLGTTFKVYLPRVDAIAEDPRPTAPPTTLRGSETILLVEDEDQVRAVASGILRRHGYTVVEAHAAGEALLLCEQYVGAIHLLVSDVVMPGMSGPELARRLVVARPEMKVLCMSGYTDDAAVRHGVVDAALAYLQKPITVGSLTRKVRAVLDSQQAR